MARGIATRHSLSVPSSPPQYDPENEAAFRRAVEAAIGAIQERTSEQADRPEDALIDVLFRGSEGGVRHYEVVSSGEDDLIAMVAWKLFDDPLPSDWFEQLLEPENLRAQIPGAAGEFTTADPQAGQLLRGIAWPMRYDALAAEYTLAGDGVEFGADGDEPPIVIDDPVFTEAPDGMSSVLSVGIHDPRGVIDGLDIFLTEKGVEEGPFPALRAGNVFSFHFDLSRDHLIYVRGRFNRNDGGDPIWIGPYSADTNKEPGIPTVQTRAAGSSIIVLVDADDTDAATLWRREVIEDVVQQEIEIQPRLTDNRFGSFTIDAPDPGSERVFRIYAKSVAGVAGEYREVTIQAPPSTTNIIETHARIVAATEDEVTIQVDATPEPVQVELLGDETTAVQTAGPNPGTKSPNGQLWEFQRPTPPEVTTAWFRGTLDGFLSDDDGVVIPPKGSEVEGFTSLTIRARVTVVQSLSMQIEVAVMDPDAATGTGDVTLTYESTVPGITPGSPQVIPGSQITDDFDTTGKVTFVVPRPAPGSNPGSILWYAARPGRVSDVDSTPVSPQQPPVMLVSTSEDSTHGYLILTPSPGSTYDSVEFKSQSGNATPSGWVNTGLLTHSVALHDKHTSAIGFRVWRGGVIVQEDWIRGFDLGIIADVIHVSVRENGQGQCAIVMYFDTDTMIGSNVAEFQILDGQDTVTSSGLLNIDATRRSLIWSTPQSPSENLRFHVRAKNIHGDWNPNWYETHIPIYIPGGGGPTVSIEPTLVSISRGQCGVSPIVNKIFWQIIGDASGHTITIKRWVNHQVAIGESPGFSETQIASGISPTDGEYTDNIFGFEADFAEPGNFRIISYKLELVGPNPTNKVTNSITQTWIACP